MNCKLQSNQQKKLALAGFLLIHLWLHQQNAFDALPIIKGVTVLQRYYLENKSILSHKLRRLTFIASQLVLGVLQLMWSSISRCKIFFPGIITYQYVMQSLPVPVKVLLTPLSSHTRPLSRHSFCSNPILRLIW